MARTSITGATTIAEKRYFMGILGTATARAAIVHCAMQSCWRSNELQRQPSPNSLRQSPFVDQWRHGDVVEREPKIASHRALFRFLPASLAPSDQLSQIRVDGWDVPKISDVTIMMELGHVVGAELIGLMQGAGVPIRIEVHQRRKCAFPKPATLNCRVRSSQNRARSNDYI